MEFKKLISLPKLGDAVYIKERDSDHTKGYVQFVGTAQSISVLLLSGKIVVRPLTSLYRK